MKMNVSRMKHVIKTLIKALEISAFIDGLNSLTNFISSWFLIDLQCFHIFFTGIE